MKRILLILSLAGCNAPAVDEAQDTSVQTIELEEVDAGPIAEPGPEDLDATIDAGVDAAIDPVVVDVIQVAAPRAPAYRHPRYATRCRRESRRDAAETITLESKDEARTRARRLARAGELDPVLILARMAYGETGTPQFGRNDNPATSLWDEPHALLAVMDSLRGQMSRVEMFVNYAPRRAFPHPNDVRQRWISELQLTGARPPSWPAPRARRFHSYPAWRSYGCPRWLATVDAIRRLLREVPARVGAGPCSEQPDHWGGNMDTHRAMAAGWRAVTCGTTLNRFWVVPERAHLRGQPAPLVVEGATEDTDDRAPDELRRDTRAPEGVQRGDLPHPGPVVLHLHGVRGSGERPSEEGTSGDPS